MTTAQKLALVGSVRPVPSRTAVLAALQLPRSTWYYQPQRRSYPERYAHLRAPLEAIAQAHPEYGYRRVTVELRDVYGHGLNHKVVQRLQRLWDLPLRRTVRPPRPSGIRQAIMAAGDRANLVAALTAIGPFEVLYADFTELRYGGGGKKAFLMALVDHATKVAVGWAVGERPATPVAVQAWQRARRTLRRRGLALRDRIVHHDRDPVFTGHGWAAQLLMRDAVRLSYTQRGPQDNPEMEAFFSRFKTENRSLLLDALTLNALRAVVDTRMNYYNRERRHSQTRYQPPIRYADELQTRP